MQNLVTDLQPDSSFLYTGPSMRPTFHPGDELQLQKRDLIALHLGDVAVFEQVKPEETISVVHRIVTKVNSQWLTRGDNNLHFDPEPLSAETFIGIVVSRQRRGRNRLVINGFSGWLYAIILFVFKWSWDRFKRLFQPLYALLRKHHLKNPIWKPVFLTLTIHTEEHGILVKTLYHSRTVARYWLRTGNYHCRKPFDLVLERPSRPLGDKSARHQPR